jgi:hypothetical protein
MDSAKRIEIVARAMARYHLGRQSFASTLNPDLIAKVCRGAEDRLWPALVEEAKAVVAALDDAAEPKSEAAAPKISGPKDEVVAGEAVGRSDEAVAEPTMVEGQTAARSETAERIVRAGDQKDEVVRGTAEKIPDIKRSGDDHDVLGDLPIAWAERPQTATTAPTRRDRTLDGLRSALAALGVSAETGKRMH